MADTLVNLPSGNEYEIVYKYLNTTITKDISTAMNRYICENLEINAGVIFSMNIKN
jgi:hypothetical protein